MISPKTPLPWEAVRSEEGLFLIYGQETPGRSGLVAEMAWDATGDRECPSFEEVQGNWTYAVHAANGLPVVLEALREADAVLKALGEQRVISTDHLAGARVTAARGCIAYALAKAEGTE